MNNIGDNKMLLNKNNQMTAKYRIYTFDKALRRTINKDYKKSDSNIGCWKMFWLIITIGALF